jgi:hypothetical protein
MPVDSFKERTMFVRHPRALVWREPPLAAPQRPPVVPRHPPTQVRWASKPWPGRLGSYIAVRMHRGELEVAVRDSPRPRWVSARQALSDREAERWAREGFGGS